MDTNILRGCRLESSSADFLRTLRTVGIESVAAPWLVLEELAAWKALEYTQKFDAAVKATKSLTRVTPWGVDVPLGPCDPERVREHWREQYAAVVEVLATSERALREGMVREANGLAPCKIMETESGKALKTGARDAAIWLSAVEYAREHPGETIYFVSANTKDFGNGTAYRAPMDQDVAGLGDRFVLLTSLDQVIARFTQPADTDDALAAEILGSLAVRKALSEEVQKRFDIGVAFSCTTSVGDVGQEVAVSSAFGWLDARPTLASVEEVKTYRIGEHEWCTAVVRWHIGGMAFISGEDPSLGSAGCAWTTSVLFTPNADDPRVTVLRHDSPRPLTGEEFNALGLSGDAPTSIRPFLEVVQNIAQAISSWSPTQGLPRAYEGALVRQVRQSAVERRLAGLLEQADADE
ncbi:PIN domain-containing protein [Streptomyces phaeochromogenes]|uniref:PIN domain-containing protein n=1 Tax=Streptomyces phaeochromogenes TaxID=1923 RepID=UPI0033E40D50